jgi:hypothetical protein
MPDDDQDESLPDVLEAVFAAVVEKARTDRGFARQLAKAVGDPAKLAKAAKRARDWNAEAPALDPRALAGQGADAARKALAPLTNRQLYALVRVHNLSPAHTGKLNKTQLIEHILRVTTREKEPAKRVFDY